MADIFVSYSREDRERVSPLIKALESQGWRVWWDREINPGDRFEERIEAEIAEAGVVLVVWSRHSINSRWVRNEALEGLDRDILVPVRLDDVRIPVAFRTMQFASFLHLPTLLNEAEFHNLVDAIQAKLESAPLDRYVRPRRFGARVSLWLGGVLASVFIALIGLWLWLGGPISGAPEGGSETDQVAVLRFQSAPEAVSRRIADGVAERIRTALVSAGSVAVVPRAAAWGVPEDQAMAELGARLGARYLIHGRVQPGAPDTRIEVRQFDVAADAVRWSREYDYTEESVLDVHESIVSDVLTGLNVRTELAERAPLTRNPEAYRHYLQGQQQLRESVGPRAYEGAKRAFERAAALDPSFAEAHAGLCRTRLAMYEHGRNARSFEAAERHCHRALTLNRNSVTAQLALGDLYAMSNQPDKARIEYGQALALDPALADAYIGLGKVLSAGGASGEAERMLLEAVSRQPGYWPGFNALGGFYIGESRLAEAIEAFSRMRMLEPDNVWSYNNLGAARFLSGDLEGAIREWERAVELDSGPGAMSNLGTALFLTRRFEEAADRYREALEITPEDHRLWGNLGDALRFIPDGDAAGAYRRQLELAGENLRINPKDTAALGRSAVSRAFLGDADLARTAVTSALEIAPNDMQVLYDAACTYASLGDPDTALAMIHRAIAAGYDPRNIGADALFDGLREEAEFHRLVTEPSAFAGEA